jgi:hypothetical protein
MSVAANAPEVNHAARADAAVGTQPELPASTASRGAGARSAGAPRFAFLSLVVRAGCAGLRGGVAPRAAPARVGRGAGTSGRHCGVCEGGGWVLSLKSPVRPLRAGQARGARVPRASLSSRSCASRRSRLALGVVAPRVAPAHVGRGASSSGRHQCVCSPQRLLAQPEASASTASRGAGAPRRARARAVLSSGSCASRMPIRGGNEPRLHVAGAAADVRAISDERR